MRIWFHPSASTLALALALGLGTAGWSSCKDGAKADDAGGSGSPSPSAQTPDVKLPGIDLSPLTPRERKEYSGYVTELLSPCAEVPVPVAQCILEKRSCAKCFPAAKFVLKAVQAGKSREEVERLYKNKFDPAAVKEIPLDGSPALGPERAPVTIYEFADFQCPACQATYPILERMLQEFPGKIRLVYKLIALTIHAKAEPAARAAIAAMWQNKFWEMHHRLFESGAQDPTGGNVAFDSIALENDARALGLDLAKFEHDIASQQTTDRFEKDKKLFEDLKGDHTPTLYLNGRETDVTDLEDTLKGELGEPPAGGGGAVDGGGASGPDAAAKPKDAGVDAKVK